MTDKEFMELAQKRVVHALALMETAKGPEYSRGGDRFSNFRAAGRILGVKPTTALLGMLVKHLVSVIDIVKDIEEDRTVILAQLQEKLTDSINYLLLLEGLVMEGNFEENPAKRREDERMRKGLDTDVPGVHSEAGKPRVIPLGSGDFSSSDNSGKKRLA